MRALRVCPSISAATKNSRSVSGAKGLAREALRARI
jgi:hypothetical protein